MVLLCLCFCCFVLQIFYAKSEFWETVDDAVVLYCFDFYSWELAFSLLRGPLMINGKATLARELPWGPPAVDVVTLMKPVLDLEFRM